MSPSPFRRTGCVATLVGLLTAACGGIKIDNGAQNVQPGDPGTVSGAEPGETNPVGSGDIAHPPTNPASSPATTAEICAVEERAASLPATKGVFLQQLVRTWLLCDTRSVFGTSDEAGIEIVADGSWYKLFAGSEGGLDRGSGLNQGTWEILPNNTINGVLAYQLNLNGPRGTILLHPQFSALPLKMYVNNNGDFSATYLAQGEALPPVVKEPEIAANYPPMACTLPGQRVQTPGTPETFTAALVGRWLTCQGSIYPNTKEIGIEFVANGTGTFFNLYPGTTPGTVVRGHGFEKEGTWSLYDQGDGKIQLNLWVTGGEINLFPVFTTSPRKMHLDNFGMFQGDFAID